MDWKRVGRNMWGWFAVCVWIVGVPNVLRYSWIGARDAVKEGVCVVSGVGCAEVLGTMSEEEFKELTVMEKANRRK